MSKDVLKQHHHKKQTPAKNTAALSGITCSNNNIFNGVVSNHNKGFFNSITATYLALSSLILLTTISGIVLTSSRTSAATDAVDEVSVDVPVACSMGGTGTNSHTATLHNGIYSGGTEDYAGGIGSTTLNIFCNDANGFSVYAIGYTNNTLGNNTLKGTNTNLTIPTGIYTSGDTTSKWSMKVTKGTDTGDTTNFPLTIDNNFNNYHIVPGGTEGYTRVAHKGSATDASAVAGATITTTYDAFISTTQAADTYTGQVKYVMVHPYMQDDANKPAMPAPPMITTANKIGYYPNANGVVDSMGDQTIEATDTEATLWASNFQRPRYGFAGWSETPDYSDSTKFHGPNETISFEAGQYSETDGGLSLYAIWVPSAGNLQGWTGCSSMSIGDVTALTDTRDNDTYAVAKLADGKCWMIENLRLDDSAELTAQNTNNPSLPLTNVYDAGATSNHLSPSTNALYDAETAPEGWIHPYDTSNTNYQSNILTVNTANSVSEMTTPKSNIYSYGNYYNWYSATAGNNSNAGDICPNGWRLPIGGDGGAADFRVLDNMLGGVGEYEYNEEVVKAWRSYPSNFVYSGYFNEVDTNLFSRGYSGKYSTSIKSNSSPIDTYILHFDANNYIHPGTLDDYIVQGNTIRCISSL